jgi:hypothetical protein
VSTLAAGAADFFGNTYGVSARSTNGIGIYAHSENYYGGYFRNNAKTQPDFVIGGAFPASDINDNCVLAADPNFTSSDLYLRGNGDVTIELDSDSDESAQFQIMNGAGSTILSLDENGIGVQTGPQSVIELKSTNSANGSVLVLNNLSGSSTYTGAINFQNTGGTRGQVAYRSNNTMDFRVNLVDAFMQLGGPVNDITMNNGAKLTKSGVWTNAPVASNARSLQKSVDPVTILSAIRDLPIHYWSSKDSQQTRHMSPAAEDFYKAFGCGEDDQHLASSDMAAVALAAVQALQRDNEILKRENISLRTQLTDLDSRLQLIENRQK